MSVERGVAKKSIRGEEDEPWETVRKGQRWTRVERRELQAAKDESGEGWKGWSEFLSSLPLDSIQLNFEITP